MPAKYYETKPCVIRAMEFDGTAENFKELQEFTNNKVHLKTEDGIPYLAVDSLEGVMMTSVGSMVVIGLRGEPYCVVRDVFDMKYQEVEI